MWRVPEIWKGGDCWIIGGGPSLPKQFGIPEELVADVRSERKLVSAFEPYLEPIWKKHVIAVNNAYQLGRWIDIIFFGDNAWYLVHEEAVLRHPALKVTCAPRFQSAPSRWGIKYVSRSRKRVGIDTSTNYQISWNQNSGAAAINLAVLFGAKRIILLGFDMQLDEDKHTHWHRGHGSNRLPPFDRHLRGFPVIAQDAERLGVDILNASDSTAITVFKQVWAKDYF